MSNSFGIMVVKLLGGNSRVALFCIAFLALLFPIDAAYSQTYYTRADGDWSDVNTWSLTCGGAVAGSIPGVTNNVVICAGQTVTYDIAGNNTIANLNVELTAVLTHPGINSANLIVQSLVLDGTINGNGDGDVRMGAVPGSTLSGSGFYSKSTTSGQLRLLSSITVLPGTDLKFNGNATFSLRGFTVTNNGRISILEPSNFSNGGTFINNAAASYLLYTRQANWPNNTDLVASAPGNTVEFGADGGQVRMNDESSYHHLKISGTAPKRPSNSATTTTIGGDLTISNGSTYNSHTGTRNINIAGNWINNQGGSFTENTSTVTFNGSANSQTLAPPPGVNGETFYDLVINNTLPNGGVTASGNVTITNLRSLRMTSGFFDMVTYTLSQASGNANLIATGGDLRLGKLSTTLPEFTGTYNITGGTITFNGSAAQTIRSLNTAPANYHSIVLSGAGTKTLAGNATVRGNWTTSGATLAGNFVVTFSGTGIQTITNTAGQLFYSVTVNATGPLTIGSASSVTVANTLTMTTGNIDLNARTLTLGNGSGATLVRTAGIAFGGTFRRYWPMGAITSAGGARYGFFPVGSAINFRPVEINSTANVTTAGYVSVQHIDATTATDVSYNDNEGDAIQRVTDMRSVIATQTLAGGTYTLNVSMTTLSAAGLLTDLKMETLAGPPYGVGTTVATTGTVSSPTVTRSGLSVTNLNNTFVVGTKNKSTTPMVATYFSRRTGNWNDVTIGNSTWSLIDGGVSCNCVPINSSIVYINPSHTVTVTSPATADFINVLNGAILNGSSNLTANYDITTFGTGSIAPTGGSWTLTRNLTIGGTSASASAAALTVAGNVTIDAGSTLTMSTTLTVAANITVHGTLAMGTSGLTLSGTGGIIDGSLGAASITGTGTITITNAKTIATAATLTIQPIISISASTTVTNLGAITHLNNLTGANNSTSIWVNESNSILNTTGSVLTTGTLTATAVPNTVNYNGAGAQIVKGTAYNNLTISNAGTKTAGAVTTVAGNLIVRDNAQFSPGFDVTVTGALTIQDNGIFTAGINQLIGSGDLIMTDNSELRIGRAVDGMYPQLTGNYSLASGTILFNQAGAGIRYDIRAVDYFNLILGATSTGGSSFDFEDGAYIANNLNVTLGGTARIRNIDGAGPLTIQNNFIFNSTSSGVSTLSNDVNVGTFTLTAGNLSVGAHTLSINNTGGWTRNGGTLTLNASTLVLFSGSDDQSINGSVTTSFTGLQIDNGGSTGVTLNQPISVSGILTLTTGNLVTTSTNLLTMLDGSSVGAVSNGSYVDGPVAKTGDTDFTFPVGKDGAYRPIAVSFISVSGTTYRAEYFHSDPVLYDVTLKDPSLEIVNTGEYWLLDRTVGGADAFVTLSWDTYSGTVNNPATLAVARWDGSSWKDMGNGGVSGSPSPGTGTVRTSALVSSFSPFTLASFDLSNPLPVELVEFSARLNSGVVDLKWITASELNNDYFTIERSQNGQDFVEWSRVRGSGTTSQRSKYTLEDTAPFLGRSYYRLRQTDYDGKGRYYGIVAVMNDNDGDATISLYPNPSVGEENIYVGISGLGSGETVTVTLIDTYGRNVYSYQSLSDGTGSIIHHVNANDLAHGVYVVAVKSQNTIVTRRLIIN